MKSFENTNIQTYSRWLNQNIQEWGSGLQIHKTNRRCFWCIFSIEYHCWMSKSNVRNNQELSETIHAPDHCELIKICTLGHCWFYVNQNLVLGWPGYWDQEMWLEFLGVQVAGEEASEFLCWRGAAKSLSGLAGSQESYNLCASDFYINSIIKIPAYGTSARWKAGIGMALVPNLWGGIDEILNLDCHLPGEAEEMKFISILKSKPLWEYTEETRNWKLMSPRIIK